MKHLTSLYFAYGANINADDMAWRCPRAQPIGAFELHHWQLELYCHATIEPKHGSSVHVYFGNSHLSANRL